MKNNLALYMHIPFCERKCAYCNFISFSASPELRKHYLNALLQEMDLYNELLRSRQVTSLYLGGGTPSLLTESELELLLEGIFKRLTPNGELNFEVNPESITRKKIRLLQSHGEFRISLGAQSFDEEVLKLFGRTHGVQEIYSACEILREEGIKRISLDIIYAIAEKFIMKKNLLGIKELQPEHLSLYALELHPHRPLSSVLEEAEEKIYLRDFGHLKEGLKTLGYQRYEISSFCKAGEESRHNLQYWQGADYLGLGLSAHGFLSPYRYSNQKNIKVYLEKLQKGERPLEEEFKLSADDLRFEAFMLGLRKTEGIDLEALGLLPLKFFEEKAIKKHVDSGLLVRENNQLKFTEKGFDLSNYVLVDFLEK